MTELERQHNALVEKANARLEAVTARALSSGAAVPMRS
jgi:hypothetical protein